MPHTYLLFTKFSIIRIKTTDPAICIVVKDGGRKEVGDSRFFSHLVTCLLVVAEVDLLEWNPLGLEHVFDAVLFVENLSTNIYIIMQFKCFITEPNHPTKFDSMRFVKCQ